MRTNFVSDMDSPDIPEQSTLVILRLQSDYDQTKAADLKEKTDNPIAAPAIVTISVTECDDPALERDTLIEDPTNAPILDAKSTFNGKSIQFFLNFIATSLTMLHRVAGAISKNQRIRVSSSVSKL